MNAKQFVLVMLWGFLMMVLIIPGVAGADEQKADKAADEPQSKTEAISTQAYLGLGVGPLHPALTAHLPNLIGKGRGVMVEHVMQESPAAKAGLQEHDILTRFKEQDLYSPEQLVKLVRNDRPGNEVTIEYVRRGKLEKATFKLGEVPAREAVRRAAFRPTFDSFPGSPVFQQQRDQAEDRERLRQNDPRPWATFKSLTITKTDDDQYKAEIDFHNQDEQILHREYIGTRDEIREAIENDKVVPKAEKQHLLRSLDQRAPRTLRLDWPRRLSDWFDFDRENFSWPNLDF